VASTAASTAWSEDWSRKCVGQGVWVRHCGLKGDMVTDGRSIAGVRAQKSQMGCMHSDECYGRLR
jgi:hypothetical protein